MTSAAGASAISALPQELWDAVLVMLEQKHSKPVYKTWLEPLRLMEFDGAEIVLGAPTPFAQDWVNRRLKNGIQEALKDLTGIDFSLRFIVVAGETTKVKRPQPQPSSIITGSEPPPAPESSSPTPPDSSGSILVESLPPAVSGDEFLPTDEIRVNNLNPRYTFDEFVVGTFNSFAHAAAQAVAEAPARAYNPLFLYGGVGLGKTHLMHAIGHRVLTNKPEANIVYVSSEKFTNEFILAIKNNQALEFRSKYRHVDILMVDDIQFLEGKEQTQEEFFHTFNSLHEASRQIIISSDRPPKEIQTLENRLRSRFEWGLLIDVQPPDLETREAILRKKAESEKLPVPDEVTSFIARVIPSNIRELEGALIRVVAYASLTKAPITVELAGQVLKIGETPAPGRVSIAVIKEKVAKAYGLSIKEIELGRRNKRIAAPRQVAMYLATELTHHSLPQIAREFQKKDHTTVMYARDRVKNLMEKDGVYREKVCSIIRMCRGEPIT